MNIYLNREETYLLIEAIDMLEIDYDYEHPDQDKLDSLETKLLKHINRMMKKRLIQKGVCDESERFKKR